MHSERSGFDQVSSSFIEQKEGESTVDYLRRLDATEAFVFHGSSRAIDELEPRDLVTDASDDLNNKRVVIYAYEHPVLAAQFAIIGARADRVGDWEVRCGVDANMNPVLETTSNVALAHGTVHVLPRGMFQKTHGEEGYQWICEKPVRVLAHVEVTPETFVELGGTHREL